MWPRIAADYGIRPWDIERLTTREANVLLDVITKTDKAHREAQSQAKSRRRR